MPATTVGVSTAAASSATAVLLYMAGGWVSRSVFGWVSLGVHGTPPEDLVWDLLQLFQGRA